LKIIPIKEKWDNDQYKIIIRYN